MLAALLLITQVGYADSTDLAHRVQIHLSAVGQPWLVANARGLRQAIPDGHLPVTFEIELNQGGGFTRVRKSLSSGNLNVDRLANSLFRVAPPLKGGSGKGRHGRKRASGAKRGKSNIPCVIRLVLSGAPRGIDIAAACLPQGQLPLVAWRREQANDEPSAYLFNGWQFEASGEGPKALGAYRKATTMAPNWDLAALAMGLSLARGGQLDEARPYLQRYAEKRKPTREVRAYIAGKDISADRSSIGVASGVLGEDGDLGLSSCERDEREIAFFVRRRMPRLNRCVKAERKRRPKNVMPEILPVSFVIVPKGAVRDISVNHRFYRDGQLGKCVAKALGGKLKPRKGSNCPGQFDIDVGPTMFYVPSPGGN